jgi:hypothetical protein
LCTRIRQALARRKEESRTREVLEEYFKKHPRTGIYEWLETKNEILPNAILKAHEHEIALEEEMKPSKELVDRAEKVGRRSMVWLRILSIWGGMSKKEPTVGMDVDE